MSTAFVLAGGGSIGAVQVGMLRELLAHGVKPDLVVGSSVGAINGAYLAGDPSLEGVQRLESIWRGLRRRDIFPITATDILGGALVKLSSGPAVDAVLASCAIPGAFPPVRVGEHHLVDGAVASNTPIRVALELGATRMIVLPSGYACALDAPPHGAIATALHAITLMIAHQLVMDLERCGGQAEIVTVPPLCPLAVSPYDFSHADELIERTAVQTRRWLQRGGLEKRRIPGALRPHED